MKICQNCQAEQPSNLATTCMYCGYEIADSSEEDNNNTNDTSPNDDNTINSNDISLDIEGPDQLLGSAQNDEIDDDFLPIGTSDPIMPESIEEQTINSEANEPLPENEDNSSIKKLSDEEIKSIEKELYGTNSYLSDNEKDKLINKFPGDEENKFGNTPIVPPTKNDGEIKPVEMPETDLPKPKFSNSKGRGIAYFHRNYIQLVSQQVLNEDDNLIVNEREYSLKPKTISKTLKLISISSAAIIVLFILSIAVFSGNSTGYGNITGFVLDENDQPISLGVTIKLPESGKSTKASPQGFFEIENVPTGAHKVEYLVDGEVVKTDYVTVVNDKQSLVLLKPEPFTEYAEAEAYEEEVTESKTEQIKEPEPPKPAEPKKPTRSKTKSVNKKKTTNKYSKVTLNANFEGAKLAIDGQIQGAGNMTYAKIKPGTHNYTVSLDGYNDKSGTFKVKAGENKKLSVILSPMNYQEKAELYDTDEYKYSAKNAYSDGDYKTALRDINAVIKERPGDAEAYSIRGESFEQLNQMADAHNDFIRSAEIYMVKKDYYNSISAYTKAIEIDKKSATAYLGRAKVYLAKGEPLAAMADYDFVVKLDKRNYDAYFGLGQAAFAQQRYKTAIKRFKDARSINSKDPLVHQYMMLSYMAVNDHKNLKKSFDKFKDVATDKEINRLYKDPKYSAVLKVIEMN